MQTVVKITAENLRPARQQSRQIAMRITLARYEKLKAKARKLGVGHTTLARTIVERWLDGT